MKGKVLLLAVACSMVGTAFAKGGGKKEDADALRKSKILKNPAVMSLPVPFNPGPYSAQSANPPAISTGYYVVDEADPAGGIWTPNPDRTPENIAGFTDTLTNPALWRTIVTGPNQFPESYWIGNPEGRPYFRNPAQMTDSTDNAFAGPIPFGFSGGFYFNGVRYDSLYISTNGLIGLSNRRYFYDPLSGARTIPSGALTAYDPQSIDTRARSGDGLNDPTPDDYGYQYIALGATSGTGTATGGLRSPSNVSFIDGSGQNVSSLSAWPGNNGGSNPTVNLPLISPFWDDTQVSVFNQALGVVDNHSKVRYYRNPDEGIFIVYYVRAIPRGAHNTWWGANGANFGANPRPPGSSSSPYVAYNVQVIFNERDGSVHFVYGSFEGVATVGACTGVNFAAPGGAFLQANSTVGVRGPARHWNYKTSTGTGSSTPTWYNQATEYLYGPGSGCQGTSIVLRTQLELPGERLQETMMKDKIALRFKQFRNSLRITSVRYNVRRRSFDASLNFDSTIANPNNFELLAGDRRLGTLQPDIVIQNLTNDIQGPSEVNFRPQPLQFRARFRIINQVTGNIVYNDLKVVDSAALASPATSGIRVVSDTSRNILNPPAGQTSWKGIPPYASAWIQFSPFESNPLIDEEIGRLRSVIAADPTLPNGEELQDQWPFDDTLKFNLFNLRVLRPSQKWAINDAITEFHQAPKGEGITMPSVLRWVNIGTEVVDGEAQTFNPPAPQGTYASQNVPSLTVNAPVVRFDRANEERDGTVPNTGDTLTSFPIDMRSKKGSILSFSYERTGRPSGGDWPRGWGEGAQAGPENRIVNADQSPTYPYPSEIAYDRFVVEYAWPTSDQLNNITNIAGPRWVMYYDPNGVQQKGTTNLPWRAYTILGGGGVVLGFDPNNPGWTLNPQNPSTTTDYYNPDALTGLGTWDDGKDVQYYKAFIPIPDTIINAPNDGAKFFRFRFRLQATMNNSGRLASDDEDPVFIDNVRILFPNVGGDIEANDVQVRWPYTITPPSQATQIPIELRVSNNTNETNGAFDAILQIERAGEKVYDRSLTIPFMAPARDLVISMPNWNARESGPQDVSGTIIQQDYRLIGIVRNRASDIDHSNDQTYTNFRLTFGAVFAYDPAEGSTNDVPTISQVTGKGINMMATTNQPQLGNGAGTFGDATGTGSGQVGMKFNLITQDTVKGIMTWFGSLNQSDDEIAISIYKANGALPEAGRPVAMAYGRRGVAKVPMIDGDGVLTFKDTTKAWDGYFYYPFNSEVILPPGTYFASVAQLGETGFELGATATSMGMIQMMYSVGPGGAFPGQAGRYVLLNKNFRERNATTGNLENAQLWAYEAVRGSTNWFPWTPNLGNPLFPNLNHLGFVAPQYNTASRGSLMPLIRPFIGLRSFKSGPTPVEVAQFNGELVNRQVRLFWETGSELNNRGFSIERREKTEGSNFAEVSFVNAHGTGNATSTQEYAYTDASVKAGATYQYRLVQKDLNGKAKTFPQVLEFTVNADGLAVEQNFPNPFSTKTNIAFTLPAAGRVTVEILDMSGNTVRTLVNEDMPAATHTVVWDGSNDAGSPLANGSYVYRVTAGDHSEVRKLTLVR